MSRPHITSKGPYEGRWYWQEMRRPLDAAELADVLGKRRRIRDLGTIKTVWLAMQIIEASKQPRRDK